MIKTSFCNYEIFINETDKYELSNNKIRKIKRRRKWIIKMKFKSCHVNVPISGTLKDFPEGAEGERMFHGMIITASIIITRRTVSTEYI